MVRAEFFMKNGDEESRKEIEDCDFIAGIGMEYSEGSAEVCVVVQGAADKMTAQALANGVIEVIKQTGKSRAEKTVNLVRFRETFDTIAQNEIYKMLIEESREGEKEEGENEDVQV